MAALDALLAHPQEAGVHGQVEARGAGADGHHAAALDQEHRDRERRLAGVFEHQVDVAIAGDLPDGLTELARLLHVVAELGPVDLGQLAPAVEVVAVQDVLGAHRQHELALVLAGHHADGVGAGHGGQLHGEDAQAPRRAPDQHVLAGLQLMRLVAEQHPVGGGERQGVAGRLFPGQVLGARQQLSGLHPAELGEAAVRRLIAPDALAGGEHRVAAVAILVVAVVLIAVDDDLVARLPPLHLRAHLPDDARGVGAGDVVGLLVAVQRADRLAQRRPDAVVVDAGGHHQDQHLVLADLPDRHDLDLHGGRRLAVPVLADAPGVHRLGHVEGRRDLADLVEVLQDRRVFGRHWRRGRHLTPRSLAARPALQQRVSAKLGSTCPFVLGLGREAGTSAQAWQAESLCDAT